MFDKEKYVGNREEYVNKVAEYTKQQKNLTNTKMYCIGEIYKHFGYDIEILGIAFSDHPVFEPYNVDDMPRPSIFKFTDRSVSINARICKTLVNISFIGSDSEFNSVTIEGNEGEIVIGNRNLVNYLIKNIPIN